MANFKVKIKHAQIVKRDQDITRIYFEDKRQDFLYWDIDSYGNVVDCGPFQKSVWIGCKLSGGQQLEPGSYIEFYKRDKSYFLRLNYAIEKTEIISKEVING